MKRFLALALAMVALFPCSWEASAADVYLGLEAYGSGGGKTLGVGLAPFTFTHPTDAQGLALSRTLRSVLREDLLFERLFTLSEGGPAPTAQKLDALAWAGVGAQVVITGDVSVQGTAISVECRVFDVGTGKVIFGKQGSGTKDNVRRLAHLLADQITFQFSGQPGIAHTRIAFVNNKSHYKEIYVMDYDGAAIQQLTTHHSIVLLPKWSPDGKSIAFNSYRDGNPDAFVMDYPAGTLHPLSARQGLNTAPNWAPDGMSLALSLSRGGDPDLYLIDRSGQIIRRLTYTPGVDTSPTFSPNGQQIAFVSDRAGNPELYVMDVTGANVQRITYGQVVDSPAWSPRGDWIAYQRRREGGQYDIYVIDSSGHKNMGLTENTGRNEHPTWSPDGRFIVFVSSREGRRRVYIMGADGSHPHPVGDLAGDSFYPSWGP